MGFPDSGPPVNPYQLQASNRGITRRGTCWGAAPRGARAGRRDPSAASHGYGTVSCPAGPTAHALTGGQATQARRDARDTGRCAQAIRQASHSSGRGPAGSLQRASGLKFSRGDGRRPEVLEHGAHGRLPTKEDRSRGAHGGVRQTSSCRSTRASQCEQRGDPEREAAGWL